jgi:hypothetical protein
MIIYDLEVTSNYFEPIGNDGCHLELEGNIKFVALKDTEFSTIEELKTAVENLKF